MLRYLNSFIDFFFLVHNISFYMLFPIPRQNRLVFSRILLDQLLKNYVNKVRLDNNNTTMNYML